MSQPLPWFIAGPLIGLIVPAVLLLREKQFGISSSYRFLGGVILPKLSYFNYNKDQDRWQFQFAIGLILSGLAATQLFGVSDQVNRILPEYSYEETAKTIYSSVHILQFLLGGFLLGFGARYANGCTAGHCIMGVSQFAWSSILATVAFFIGGLLGSHFINPIIF
jgi:uncharacterized membrane protein YedE/YeeE